MAFTGSRPSCLRSLPAGFTFVRGEEILRFHTGLRRMWPLIRTALSRIVAPERLRWVTFGHYEADEWHRTPRWRTGRPHVSCRSTPRTITDGEVIDLGGGKRVRYVDTPHVPHGWEAGVLYEESTSALLGGDLFTQIGDAAAVTSVWSDRRSPPRICSQPAPKYRRHSPPAR
jgi:hypothetical protein